MVRAFLFSMVKQRMQSILLRKQVVLKVKKPELLRQIQVKVIPKLQPEVM